MNEAPICPECGAKMKLAPGIDYFCETKGCELKKLKALFAKDAADMLDFEQRCNKILDRLDAEGGEFASETAEVIRRLLPMIRGHSFT